MNFVRLGLFYDPFGPSKKDFKWRSNSEKLLFNNNKFNRWGLRYDSGSTEPNNMLAPQPERIVVNDYLSKKWRTRKTRDTNYPIVCEQRKALIVDTPFIHPRLLTTYPTSFFLYFFFFFFWPEMKLAILYSPRSQTQEFSLQLVDHTGRRPHWPRCPTSCVQGSSVLLGMKSCQKWS